MESRYVPTLREPILLIKNISQQTVHVFGIVPIAPGETKEVFSQALPLSRDDLVTRAIRELSPPNGQLYLDFIVHRVIDVLDFRTWVNSVDYTQLRTSNNAFNGGVLGFQDGSLRWLAGGGSSAVAEPLESVDGYITLPQASAYQDGYLSSDDYQYLFSSVRRRIKMWQYQDFTAPLSSNLTITAFQNGTGLDFDSSYIVNDSASIVLQSDLNAPPTSTISFPGKYLPGNRVKVDTQISETVILNQSPQSTLNCRIYFLISLPDGELPPEDYQEAPQFLKNSPTALLDENYLNQNDNETAYGNKTFAGAATFDGTITYSPGAEDGYVMTSDASGVASWQPISTGGGSTSADQIMIASTPPGDGYFWLDTDEYVFYSFDAVRGKWLGSDESFDFSGGATVFNSYLHAYPEASSAKMPFVAIKDLTLIGLFFNSENSVTVDINVIVGATTYPFSVSATSSLEEVLDIDVNKGDLIRISVLNDIIRYPRASLLYRRRGI